MSDFLKTTINLLLQKGKGILAADESVPTIGKRFALYDIANTQENRSKYRSLLATTAKLADFISGVILFTETLEQKIDNHLSIANCFNKAGILTGLKVDQGLIPLTGEESIEKTTKGLDSLPELLCWSQKLGVRFAKWRCIYNIGSNMPSDLILHVNAEVLARYAYICQSFNIVPIVEPEVLMDGEHSIEDCYYITVKVLHSVFQALRKNKVKLEYILLKPNMVLPGKYGKVESTHLVAEYTLKALLMSVPAIVPGINFLSGGQSADEACYNLNALAQHNVPWNLSFSFGRALQEECLRIWRGKEENIKRAQDALWRRAKLCSLATQGMFVTLRNEYDVHETI